MLSLQPNRTPEFEPLTPRQIQAGTVLIVPVVTDDLDGDAVVLTARLDDGRALSDIGATFVDHRGGTGTLQWTPTVAQAGAYAVVFTANDGQASTSTTLAITVVTLEADVAPRDQNGNGILSVSDWVQVGRYVAALDPVPTGPGSAFQKADCAPRQTGGDGRLTVSDWVQAGRYVAALDPPQAAEGPTAPSTPSSLTDHRSAIQTVN